MIKRERKSSIAGARLGSWQFGTPQEFHSKTCCDNVDNSGVASETDNLEQFNDSAVLLLQRCMKQQPSAMWHEWLKSVDINGKMQLP